MLLSILSLLTTATLILICVSFYTLFERKILGVCHSRLGPLSTSFLGLLQPFADGLKLFSKSTSIMHSLTLSLYFLTPISLLLISFSYLWFLEGFGLSPSFSTSVLGLLSLLILSAYPSIFVGWSSTSEWALLGAVRNMAMIISFEVGLSFLVIGVGVLAESCSFHSMSKAYTSLFLLSMAWCALWMVSIGCELNRTPFDLGEAESELVSGINIEYSGGGFSFLFISEYMNMIFLSCLSAMLMFCSGLSGGICFSVTLFLMYLLVWLRGSLPRVRYDKMMSMFWLIVLPAVLAVCMLHIWGLS